MSWLEWSASVIASVAWPVTVLVLAVVGRKHIGTIAEAISKVRWGDIEIDLSTQVEAVEEAAESVTTVGVSSFENTAADEEVSERTSEAIEVAAISPESSILLAWKELESEINSTAHRLGIAKATRRIANPTYSLQYLINTEKLSKDDQRLIMQMRRLRNDVAHARRQETNLTEENAHNFAWQIEYLIKRLRSLD